MNGRRLRSITGLTILFFHLATVFVAVIFFLKQLMLFDELTTTLAIVTPMLGVYASGYIAHVAAKRRVSKARDATVSTEFAVLTILLCLVFGAGTLSLVVVRALMNDIISFEQCKRLLGVSQVTLGALSARLYFTQFSNS